MKTTNGVVTKYVYGKGLIGEETSNTFKTYHFDCRGSTIAITDVSGNITDTFTYDTYGKLISRTGTSKVIFGYNGRDGVVTDDNGLIYMRARYYSPEMKRFINADIVAGKLSNAITLNRFAYANGNPVSFVDPFGLTAERGGHGIGFATLNFNTKASFFRNKYHKKKIDDNIFKSYLEAVLFLYEAYEKITNLEAYKDADQWCEDAEKNVEEFFKDFKNDDGTYSIYDSMRGKHYRSIFHGQALSFDISTPSVDIFDEGHTIGLGSIELDLSTAGWEWENIDLSLFDFGHAEISAEFDHGLPKFGALVSAYSPSVAFDLFGTKIELGLEVGAIGFEFDLSNEFDIGVAYGLGFDINIEW